MRHAGMAHPKQETDMKTSKNASQVEAKNADLIVLGAASVETKGPNGVIEFVGRQLLPGICED
ncbi:benenodin family lasso peptide [Pseudoxanthomonas winnipegensis]|jgi:hypothetical protein|uniref:Uncharacterized protein n=1 Tax=Rhodanobacter denitrificans TaxID=666685 RepID=A0A2W5LPS8_9GAMM|nr:MAG: hypothetical protein DI564_17840 [Rhodanobacter denitrificans]RZZ90225.1 benenodin family lasso peptide [Pseudoxanthomonas winnipegensis]